MEKRKEYGFRDEILCPKCESDDLDCDDAPEKAKCLTCGLEFTIRQVAVWEERIRFATPMSWKQVKSVLEISQTSRRQGVKMSNRITEDKYPQWEALVGMTIKRVVCGRWPYEDFYYWELEDATKTLHKLEFSSHEGATVILDGIEIGDVG